MSQFRSREFIFPGHKFLTVNALMKSKMNFKFATYLDTLTLGKPHTEKSEEETKEQIIRGRYSVINYPLRAIVGYADMLAVLALSQLREHSVLKGKYTLDLTRSLSYKEGMEIIRSLV